MNNYTKKNLTQFSIIFIISIVFACSSVQLTKEEQNINVVSIQKMDDDEIKEMNKKCIPIGKLDYVHTNGGKGVRQRAVKIGADTAQLYYYDTASAHYVVRYWKCK